ncbi:MAG: hypothetical protein WCB58_14190 [Acidobacteriaceae bacterium]
MALILPVTNPIGHPSHSILISVGAARDSRYLLISILVQEDSVQPKTWGCAFIDNQHITGGAPQATVPIKVKK